MPRILVVDDNAEIREMVCSALAICGHEISQATDGTQVTRMYREQPFDLVITDLVMPHVEGIELIKSLRGIDQNVKVVAMSGVAASDTYLKTAKFLGAQHILHKPFTVDELLSVVNAALAPT